MGKHLFEINYEVRGEIMGKVFVSEHRIITADSKAHETRLREKYGKDLEVQVSKYNPFKDGTNITAILDHDVIVSLGEERNRKPIKQQKTQQYRHR